MNERDPCYGSIDCGNFRITELHNNRIYWEVSDKFGFKKATFNDELDLVEFLYHNLLRERKKD